MGIIKKNIRKHKHYRVAQGSCTDGKNIYVIYEWKHKYHIIVVYDKNGKQLRKSGRVEIGHGNSVAYRNGYLYIVHSKGKDVIHVVNAKTLKVVKNIPIKWNKKRWFNSIAAIPGGFALHTQKNKHLVIVDNNFKKLKEYKFGKRFGHVQGMTYHKGKLYRAFSKYQTVGANYIGVYNMKGKLLKKKNIKIKGELESLFWIGDVFYGIIHRRVKKKGKWVFTTKLFKMKAF